jgi:hypothetical protein
VEESGCGAAWLLRFVIELLAFFLVSKFKKIVPTDSAIADGLAVECR